jgi:hypothetical protein
MSIHRVYCSVDGCLIPTGHDFATSSTSPVEDIIRACDDMAKNAARDDFKPSNTVGYAYKVDGSLEYYVSKYYFKWPNYVDREENGKDSSEGQSGSRKKSSNRGSRRNRGSDTGNAG